jgi:hypothetical protein
MRAVIVLIALAALAACGSKEAKKPEGASFGPVLPGSASDAMLPYDTASSSPPLAAETYEAPEDEGPSRVRSRASDAAGDEVAPEAEPS